jgi:hypothetical protein
LAEASARGVEANKRKREAKAAQKEQRKQVDSQNFAKAPNHVAALLEELTVLAEEELK